MTSGEEHTPPVTRAKLKKLPASRAPPKKSSTKEKGKSSSSQTTISEPQSQTAPKRKRTRQQQSSSPVEAIWQPKKTLSEHPEQIRAQLFKNKIGTKPIVKVEKYVKVDDFHKWGVLEPIIQVGWTGILEMKGDECYDEEIVEWMSTLRRHGKTHKERSLVGTVRGQECILTLQKIRDLLKVDTAEREYQYPDETYLSPPKYRRERQEWLDRVGTVFALSDDDPDPANYTNFNRFDLRPEAQVLWRLGAWNIFPWGGDLNKVRFREVTIIYALLTQRITISYAHLVMLQLWATFDIKSKKKISHGYLLSKFLKNEGVIAPTTMPRVLHDQYRIFTQRNVRDLKFTLTEEHAYVTDKYNDSAYEADLYPEEREEQRQRREERRQRREERNIVEEAPSSPPRGGRVSRGISSSFVGTAHGIHEYSRMIEMMERIEKTQPQHWEQYTANRLADRAYFDECRKADRAYFDECSKADVSKDGPTPP